MPPGIIHGENAEKNQIGRVRDNIRSYSAPAGSRSVDKQTRHSIIEGIGKNADRLGGCPCLGLYLQKGCCKEKQPFAEGVPVGVAESRKNIGNIVFGAEIKLVLLVNLTPYCLFIGDRDRYFFAFFRQFIHHPKSLLILLQYIYNAILY